MFLTKIDLTIQSLTDEVLFKTKHIFLAETFVWLSIFTLIDTKNSKTLIIRLTQFDPMHTRNNVRKQMKSENIFDFEN